MTKAYWEKCLPAEHSDDAYRQSTCNENLLQMAFSSADVVEKNGYETDEVRFVLLGDEFLKYMEEHTETGTEPDIQALTTEYCDSVLDDEDKLNGLLLGSGLDKICTLGILSFLVGVKTPRTSIKLDAAQKLAMEDWLKTAFPNASGVYVPGYVMNYETISEALEGLDSMGKIFFRQGVRTTLGKWDDQVSDFEPSGDDSIYVVKLYIPFFLETKLPGAVIHLSEFAETARDSLLPAMRMIDQESDAPVADTEFVKLFKSTYPDMPIDVVPYLLTPDMLDDDYVMSMKQIRKAIKRAK